MHGIACLGSEVAEEAASDGGVQTPFQVESELFRHSVRGGHAIAKRKFSGSDPQYDSVVIGRGRSRPPPRLSAPGGPLGVAVGGQTIT